MEGTLPGLSVAAQFCVNQRKWVVVRESDASWQALRCVSHTLQEEGSPCEWPHQAFCVPTVGAHSRHPSMLAVVTRYLKPAGAHESFLLFHGSWDVVSFSG